MEAEKSLRRRLSANSIITNNSDNDNENGHEEGAELLRNREADHGPQSIQKAKVNASCQDLSYWIRPAAIFFTSLFLATIFFRALIIFQPWLASSMSTKLSESGVFENEDREPTLGIQLFPELHISRPPRTNTYHWNISLGTRWPDGVKKKVYLVNELFPGPTIECRSGDRLVIHVTNSLSEGVSIHWHGLKMREANNMDGAVGFTQCPIAPGKSFTYEFSIGDEESGTFWWHAHSQVQRGDGMYGGLIVHKASQEESIQRHDYVDETLLLIGDWYHRTAGEVLEWYTSVRGFGNEPVPDSLLVNGEGRFICSMAVPARPVECVQIPETMMKRILGPGKTSQRRLRIVNVGSLAGFTLSINSAHLTPLEIDGGFQIVGTSSASVGILYPGERIDVLLDWHEDPRIMSSSLHVNLDPTTFKYPNQALRPNQTFPMFMSSNSNVLVVAPSSEYISSDLTAAKAVNISFIPPAAQKTVLLYTKTQKLSISSNHPKGYMNRTTWSPQTPPLISLSRSKWNNNQLVPFIPQDIWVDIILNNLDDDAHPFHLHGNSFYVLASHRSEHGWGSYNPYSGISKPPTLDLKLAVRRDTVMVPRRGYVILRFKADNPGIWMLHCHILFHQASGMAMGLHIGKDESFDDDLQSSKLCVT